MQAEAGEKRSVDYVRMIREQGERDVRPEAEADDMGAGVVSAGADEVCEMARGGGGGEGQGGGAGVTRQVGDEEVVVLGEEVRGYEGPFGVRGEGAVDEEDGGFAGGVLLGEEEAGEEGGGRWI